MAFLEMSSQFGVGDLLFLYSRVVSELLLITMYVLWLDFCRPRALGKDARVLQLRCDARWGSVSKPDKDLIVRIRCRCPPCLQQLGVNVGASGGVVRQSVVI